MSQDKYDTFTALYNEIGHELQRITGTGSNDLYLYAEVEEGATGAGVFKDEGQQVRYFDPSSLLCDLLDELWHAEEPSKRWAVMEYSLSGTHVHATFMFSEDLKPDEGEYERRERALRARYGDKPIIYPPVPPGMMEYKGRSDRSD